LSARPGGERGTVVMSIYRIKNPDEEPHRWKTEKFAEIDGNEMLVRHVTEPCEIVNATLIVEQQREDVKSCIMSILVDGLMPAFGELRKIRDARARALPSMDIREL
jgi:hypothetical protein